MRNAYNILVVKPEGKRPLERLRQGREDNIRIDLREIGWELVDLIHLTQDMGHWQAHMYMVRKLRLL
jgi:hypothetical protein